MANNNSRAVSAAINSRAYNTVKKQLKASLNNVGSRINFGFGSRNDPYDDIFGYGFLEEKESDTKLKFRISKSQYNKLLKNLNSAHLFKIFDIFELSKEEIQGLFDSIEDGDTALKCVIIGYLEGKEITETAIDSIINDSNIFTYIANCESYASMFSNLARIIIKKNDRTDHSAELIKLFEKFESRLKEFPEELKKKILENYTLDRQQFLVYDKKEILEKICKVMLVNNEKPSLEFIEKYECYFGLRQLLQLYKAAQEDIPYSEGISKYLKRQCEHRLRDELGPAAEAIEINMNWDMHSIALFDEINEDTDCGETEAY